MAGVAGMFGGSLFSAMHGSLVTSSLIRETTENESQNYCYKFGQEEETYNIAASYFEIRLIFQCFIQQLKKSSLFPSSISSCMRMVNLYGYLQWHSTLTVSTSTNQL